MIFASDNWSGAHPSVNAAIAEHGTGMAAPYGGADLDREVERRFDAVFERECAVFMVATGTAANSLAFSAVNRPGGVVLCHREAHVIEDECGAPEFFTHGARMGAIDGPCGKIDPGELERRLARFTPDRIEPGQPMAVSITQPTEAGTVYTADEIARIAAIAHRHDLPLHMDGARFANGLAATGLSPADATWKLGVDILSFGGTKNGCWCAEAVVFFDPGMAEAFPYLRKRSGQLFSKMRFVSAQFMAYLADGLWRQCAEHANAVADRLRAGIEASPSARLAWPTQTNEVFVIMANETAERLYRKGADFYDWNMPADPPTALEEGEGLFRLVAGWASEPAHADAFLEALG